MKSALFSIAVIICFGAIRAVLGPSWMAFDHFAAGMGQAIAVLLLGCLGRFYRPNPFRGFVVATAIFAVFDVFVVRM